MILEFDGAFFWMGVISADGAVGSIADEHRMILGDYAVVEDGDDGGFFEFTVFETRSFENDVVGLPFAWFAGGVYLGWEVAIDGGCLAIGIGFVFVVIEDLHFVASE